MALQFSMKKDLGKTNMGVKIKRCLVTLDNAYPTGGWEIKATDLGFEKYFFGAAMSAGGAAGYPLIFTATETGDHGHLMAYKAIATEADNNETDMNLSTIMITAFGY